MRVRLKDLSDHLELSTAQISRALGGYSDVSEETRRRVAKAAKELGYRPSQAGRGLRSGRARAVSLVLPPNLASASSAFHMRLIAALSDALAERDHDLVVSSARRDEGELGPLRRLVAERRTDGAILTRTRRHDPRVAYLLEQKFPFVVYGRTQADVAVPWVNLDGAWGVRAACRRLARLGHRRIAFVGVDDEHMALELRVAAFEDEVRRLGLCQPSELIVRTRTASGLSPDDIAPLYAQAHPTACICATDGVVVPFLRRLRERGLRHGVDMAVIAFGDVDLGELTDPPLTTIEHPVPLLGRAAVDLLFRAIDGESADLLHATYKPTIAFRGSDVPPTDR